MLYGGWVQRTGHHDLALHGPSIHNLNYIYKVLRTFKTANELCVVRSSVCVCVCVGDNDQQVSWAMCECVPTPSPLSYADH